MVGTALVLLVGVLTVANYRFSVASPGGNDFLGRWNAAQYWLVRGVNPYDPQVSQATQKLIYGRLADTKHGEETGDFIYPLPAMLFFGPFGFLPFTLARALWMTLLELCLPALVLMGIRLASWKTTGGMLAALMLFSALWYHGIRAVIVGQYAVIEAVLIAAALLAIQRRQDGIASVMVALSLCKPQMVVFLLPYLLVWAFIARRWGLLVGSLLASAVLIGASIVIMPTWPVLWLRQLVAYPGYAYLGPPMEILAGLLPRGSAWANLILSGLILVGLGWEWIRSLGHGEQTFLWTAQITIVVTNLVAFRTATTNYVVMLPALILVFSVWHGRWGRAGSLAVYFSLAVLLVGLWALFLATVVGNTESSVMYIPLPFLALIGLLWIRWWATREVHFRFTDASPS